MSGRFAVMAETHDGNEFVLRLFSSKDAAEDHPVKLALWKRVWIKEVAPPPAPEPSRAPRPWSVEKHGNSFWYVRAADGQVIATLLGPALTRQCVVAVLEGLV